jgi:hypothetical protein
VNLEENENAGSEGDGGGTGLVPAPPVSVPPVVVQFLENQKQELAVRAQEAEVQRLQIDNERLKIEKAHEYAMKAVDLQAQDRREERDSDGKGISKVLVLLGLAVVGVLAFFGYALFSNKDQMILEILRILVYAGGGGGIGYAIGHKQSADQAKTNTEQQN